MFSMPRDILETMTDVFQLERNQEIIRSIRGFYCDNKHPNTIQSLAVHSAILNSSAISLTV